uniref:Golgi SNAP receptor complex member 1 n=1 Tax=Panagrellus redivivus TaxID=6233 RepID=A0A7E4VWF6_PANRE
MDLALREEARVLGATIDSKLHALNKYSTTGPRYKAVESAHFTRSKRAVFTQDAQEVEDLLRRLEDANQQLEAILSKKPGGSSDQHVVRRFDDVLKDYTHEFYRIREIVEKQMDRDDLLGGGLSNENDSFLNNRTRSSEVLLAEHEHITSSERMIDEQLSMAMAVKENLNHQQRRIGGAMHQLQITMKKYPAINNVMQKIRMKKRKDTLILAGVIATCFILLFLYITR